MAPFLTIVTRACRRPKGLIRAIDSVMCQTSRDWELLLIVDREGKGLKWANEQFCVHADKPRGCYVYHLDDDSFIEDWGFVDAVYRRAVFNDYPDVILVRSRGLPPPEIWSLNWEKGERPEYWIGSGYCFVVKSELWQAQAWRYHHGQGISWHTGGDWHFMTGLLELNPRIIRLNVNGARGVRGKGQTFEVKDGVWFDNVARFYDLEDLGDDVWRLCGGNTKD